MKRSSFVVDSCVEAEISVMQEARDLGGVSSSAICTSARRHGAIFTGKVKSLFRVRLAETRIKLTGLC